MGIAVGFNSWITYIEEAAWGTWLTPTKSIKIISEDFRLEDPKQERKSLGSPISPGFYLGRKNVVGSFTAEMLYTGQEAFLYNAFGSVSTSSSSPNYQHTYSIVDPLPPGMSIETEKDSSYFRWEGCMCNTLNLNMTDLELLQGIFNFIGEDQESYSSAAGTATAFPVDDPILPWQDATYNFAATLDGDAVTGGIREANFTLDNKISGDRPNLGARTIQQPVRGGMVGIGGTFTTDFRSESIAEWYTDFVNGTAVAVLLTYSKDANTSFQVSIPAAKYNGVTPPVDNPGVLTASVPFIAPSATIILKNQTVNGQTG